MDATSAYWCIPLHPDSREITAFSTPWGLFHWPVMPFGLMNAGSVYFHFIAKVLEEGGTDPEKTSSYLDDAIIGTKDTREHIEELCVVMEAHKRVGTKLNPGKTMLCAVLSRKQPGGEKLIAACGRRTSSYEKNYPSHKGELCAIVFGVQKFEHLCKFATFKVHTDALEDSEEPDRHNAEVSGGAQYLLIQSDP